MVRSVGFGSVLRKTRGFQLGTVWFSESAVVNKRLAVSSKPADICLLMWPCTVGNSLPWTLVSDDHLTPPFFDPVISSAPVPITPCELTHQTINEAGVVAIDCNGCQINMRSSICDQSLHVDVKVTGDATWTWVVHASCWGHARRAPEWECDYMGDHSMMRNAVCRLRITAGWDAVSS